MTSRSFVFAIAALGTVTMAAHVRAQPAAPGTLTKPPALVKFVEAPYPPGEPVREALVTLRVDIGANGKVIDAAVTVSAGPAFDEAALAAVKQFEFAPAEIDGKPAPVRILYEYQFKVEVKVEQKSTGELAGIVRDRDTKQPLAGVVIVLDDGTRATTDAKGAFVFDAVQPGARTLTLSSPTITAVQTQETIEAGKRLDVVYEVSLAPSGEDAEDADDLEIVVTAPKVERQAASVAVAAGVARRVPGTGGDVVKVVESMPGVARAAAGSGQLVVWGASPDDTRVYVDGVRIPRLYHAGGLRSVLAAELVKSIELVPGGWGVEHGRSLGGLVEISLVPLDDKPAGAVAVDAIDSAAAVRVPITDRVRIAAAARKSQLAWLLGKVSDEPTSELVPIPSYVDGQARIAYVPSTKSRFDLVAIGSHDRVTRTVASSDPAMVRSDDARIGFWRTWLAYHADTDDGGLVDVVAFGGRDTTRREERFGARPTELAVGSNLGGVRASWRHQRGPVSLAIGLDAELVHATIERQGALTVPAREGDIGVFGQPPPDQLVADRWNATSASAAPFVQTDISLLGDRLHVIPGLRFEPFFVAVSRRTPIAGATPSVGLFTEDTTLQPRLAVRFDPTARVRLTAAAGRYRQPPQPEELSAVFGNPTLPISSAMHLVVGAAVKWTKLFSTELTGFATQLDELAVRSPSSTPRLAAALEPIGSGGALGIQALVRRELADGVFGWISYTLSRAARTDGPDREARRFDFDQTHVLTMLISWDLGRGFEVGARFRYATGAPRTPVIGSYYDNRTDQYQPMFGAHNSDRLPAFASVDARVSKQFRVQGGDAEVYLDLQNVTNRENAEEVVYSVDFTQRSTIRGLPILPVLGARWAW